jgi:signal transduction histidine kinase
MEAVIRILKRLEEWGTAWRTKLTGDLFFRTAVYVIALQVGLVIVSIATFSWVLHYTNQQVINTIASHFAANAPNGSFSPVLPESIDAIQNESVRYVFAGIIAVAILFGTLLAYVTLRPARTSLQYQKLFISNVAHELRTPLSTIKTSTEVVLLDDTIPDNVREVLSDTLIELDRISEIINNLLSLNQFLRPERMGFANVDLGPLIESVVRRASGLASQFGIELHVRKNSEYCTVFGNATALEQVLTNLVKNAISYTPKGKNGIVTITTQPDYRGSIIVTVSDNGIGIAQKDLFHIFEPFYRADLSRARQVNQGGTGLGLAIVSEIVRAHHGKINIQSAVNKGTTVSITLPAGTTAEGETVLEAQKEPLSEVSVDFSRGQ